jgi:hypothetical protein
MNVRTILIETQVVLGPQILSIIILNIYGPSTACVSINIRTILIESRCSAVGISDCLRAGQQRGRCCSPSFHFPIQKTEEWRIFITYFKHI